MDKHNKPGKAAYIICLVRVHKSEVPDRKQADKLVSLMNDSLDATAVGFSPVIESYSLPKTKPDRKIIDAAIAQIKSDVATGDLTAIEELLRYVPRANLVSFLSDETQLKRLTPSVVFQPDFSSKQAQDELFSFEVYTSRVRCEQDFPGVSILEYKKSDIEEPTVVDW